MADTKTQIGSRNHVVLREFAVYRAQKQDADLKALQEGRESPKVCHGGCGAAEPGDARQGVLNEAFEADDDGRGGVHGCWRMSQW